MENSLFEGDYIIVNKLNYGGRLPQSYSEIPWISLFVNGNQASKEGNAFSNDRLIGFQSISRNDIIVFNHPSDVNEYYIKRCIGLPGDSIAIENNKVFVNNTRLKNTATVKIRYSLTFNPNNGDFSSITYNLKIPYQPDWLEQKSTLKTLYLTDIQRQELETNPNVIFRTESPQIDPQIGSSQFKQLWIPKKNSTISLNSRNIKIYTALISRFEGQNPVTARTKLTFKNNYYFFLGDNRNASVDSRAWGLVPENYIVGKASFIIFSYDKKNGINWNRLFSCIK